MKTWLLNPMLNKEIRVRFRSLKTFIGLFLFLAILHGAMAFAIYVMAGADYQETGFITAELSQRIYWGLVIIQITLVLMITPGLTAGTISAEREKQTLNVLLTTTQSSLAIIYSKIVSSVLFFILLMVAALPTYAIVFLYGGISIVKFMVVMGLLLVTVFFIASYSTLISSFFRRSNVAVIVAYGVTFITNALFYVGLRLLDTSVTRTMKQETITEIALWMKSMSIMTVLETYLSRSETNYSIEIERLAAIPLYYLAVIIVSSVLCMVFAAWRLRPSLRSRK